jgi:YHS domain-containing protein
MLRVLLITLLLIFLVRAFWRLTSGLIDGVAGDTRPVKRVPMVRDPVCGTFVVPSQDLMVVRGERVTYFCSERCRSVYAKGGA